MTIKSYGLTSFNKIKTRISVYKKFCGLMIEILWSNLYDNKKIKQINVTIVYFKNQILQTKKQKIKFFYFFYLVLSVKTYESLNLW